MKQLVELKYQDLKIRQVFYAQAEKIVRTLAR